MTMRCAAATSSMPSSTAISCSRRTSSVNRERAQSCVEGARLVERGDVAVDERNQPLTLDEFSKLSLICLLAHCGPSRTTVDYSGMETER